MYLAQFCGLQREGVEGEGWATDTRPAATPRLRTKAPYQPSPEAPPHPCCGSAYARADWLRRGQSEPGCPARSGPDSVLLCRGRGSPATAVSHRRHLTPRAGEGTRPPPRPQAIGGGPGWSLLRVASASLQIPRPQAKGGLQEAGGAKPQINREECRKQR